MRRSELTRRMAVCGRAATLAGAILACGSSQSQTQSAPASAAPASVTSSVMTVGNLIMLENAAAMRSIQKARSDAGLVSAEQPRLMTKAGPTPAAAINVDVLAVLGTEGNLRAHLSADGQFFYNATPGTNVRDCVVEIITPRCVVFSSLASEIVTAKPAAGRGKAKSTESAFSGPTCPQSCWTGVQRPQMAMPGSGMPGAMVGMPGTPMPMPSPVVGTATSPLQGQAGVGQAGVNQIMNTGTTGGAFPITAPGPRPTADLSPGSVLR